jgi:hypothetical protein
VHALDILQPSYVLLLYWFNPSVCLAMLLSQGDYSSSYERFDFQVSIGKRGIAYLTASMFDVVNEEDHDDPEQQYSQVTARREVGYLQDRVAVGQSQGQRKSSNTKKKQGGEKKEAAASLLSCRSTCGTCRSVGTRSTGNGWSWPSRRRRGTGGRWCRAPTAARSW